MGAKVGWLGAQTINKALRSLSFFSAHAIRRHEHVLSVRLLLSALTYSAAFATLVSVASR